MPNQTEKNTAAIAEIQQDIKTIKDNHLHHIEKDMSKMEKTIDKMDMRIWAILVLLVGSVILGAISNGVW